MENRPVYLPFWFLIAIAIQIITQWIRYGQMQGIFRFYFNIQLLTTTTSFPNNSKFTYLRENQKKNGKMEKIDKSHFMKKENKKEKNPFDFSSYGEKLVVCVVDCLDFLFAFDRIVFSFSKTISKVFPFNLLLFFGHFSW